jgi:Mg2+ and Co2+ transporter CorA
VYNTHLEDWKIPKQIEADLEKLSSSMGLIDKYEAREVLKSQKKSIDVLTYVSIIILPLTLITGYFGMNFLSMGAPATNTGILTLHWGQVFVFFLFITSLVFSISYLNHSYSVG